MFNSLTVFRTAHALAAHAGQRQAVIAQNVANADTPGYAAQGLPRFDQVLRPTGAYAMRRTRPGHFGAAPLTRLRAAPAPAAATDPNGNSVSVEIEIMKSVAAKRDHDRALAIYRSALGLLRSALSRN